MFNIVSKIARIFNTTRTQRAITSSDTRDSQVPQRQTDNLIMFNFKDLPELNLRVKLTHVTRKEFLAVTPNSDIVSRWQPGFGDNVPATHMTWQETVDWIKELNTRTGQSWRLPTTAEAYAIALAGRDAMPTDEDIIEQEASLTGSIKPVASKKPSPAGIFDVIGLVWTWCSDIEDKSEYDGKFVYPVAGIVGGSFYYSPKACANVIRAKVWRECRCEDFGFRLVSDLK